MPGITEVSVETTPQQHKLGYLLEGGIDAGLVLWQENRIAIELTALFAIGAHEQRRWIDIETTNDSWYWNTYMRAGIGTTLRFMVSRQFAVRARIEGGALFRLASSREISFFLAPVIGIEWG